MARVIIAGGRDFDDRSLLASVLMELFWIHGAYDDMDPEVEIVSGGARGADTLGEKEAQHYGLAVTTFPAKWDELGRYAGIARNKQMAEYADILVAFWDGKSRGTRNMIDTALEYGLTVHVYRYVAEPKDPPLQRRGL